METLTIYLLKSAALMSGFFVAYFLLLRKETFFTANRWYLIIGLVTSVILPLITFEKVVWVEPQAGLASTIMAADFAPALQQVTPTPTIDWLLVAFVIYLMGVVVFLIKFAADVFAVYRILKGRDAQKDKCFLLVDVPDNVSPFSFFKFIVFNSQLYTIAELRNIIEHEKVHCRQNHTADVLIAQFFCIAFWWNPLVWLHKKAILQNLEFIADSEASKNVGDIKSYQFTLLKITTHNNCVAITNHFYQSLIKKRIVMLNKNQSKRSNALKYALIIPALAAFIFYFQVQVVAQERNEPFITGQQPADVEVIVDKDATDFYLNSESKRVKEEHGITLKFSGIKRNKSREIIAIKTSFKDKDGNSGKSSLSGSQPIAPFRFYKGVDQDGNMVAAIGNIGERSVTRTFVHHSTPPAPAAPHPSGAPEVPEAPIAPKAPSSFSDIELPDGERMTVETITENGKTTVKINGEVVANVDPEEILASLDPIIVNGIDVLRTGKSGGANTVHIDTEKIVREAIENARSNTLAPRHQIGREQMELSRKQRELSKAQREISKEQREISKEQREKNRAVVRSQIRIADSNINSMSAEELAAAKRALEAARSDMEQAKRDIEQAGRDLEKAQKELQQYRKELDSKK